MKKSNKKFRDKLKEKIIKNPKLVEPLILQISKDIKGSMNLSKKLETYIDGCDESDDTKFMALFGLLAHFMNVKCIKISDTELVTKWIESGWDLSKKFDLND